VGCVRNEDGLRAKTWSGPEWNRRFDYADTADGAEATNSKLFGEKKTAKPRTRALGRKVEQRICAATLPRPSPRGSPLCEERMLNGDLIKSSEDCEDSESTSPRK
jgi:hypothetical protein